MSASSYRAGEAIEIVATFSAPAGEGIAATGVQIRARAPDGSLRNCAVAAGDVAGQWKATLVLDLPGRWWVAAECAGPTPAIDETPITVVARAVPPTSSP